MKLTKKGLPKNPENSLYLLDNSINLCILKFEANLDKILIWSWKRNYTG
jgi:hypothetical protein